MADKTDQDVWVGLERVKVSGSPTDHLAAPKASFTLCARVGCYPIRFTAHKPMCRRCTIEAALAWKQQTP